MWLFNKRNTTGVEIIMVLRDLTTEELVKEYNELYNNICKDCMSTVNILSSIECELNVRDLIPVVKK